MVQGHCLLILIMLDRVIHKMVLATMLFTELLSLTKYIEAIIIIFLFRDLHQLALLYVDLLIVLFMSTTQYKMILNIIIRL